MKFLANDLKTTAYATGGIGLSFDATIAAKEEITSLKRGDYVITIEKATNKRTLSQNAYLWELIGQISMKENGNRAGDEQIYRNILIASGVGVEYLQGLPATKTTLETFYRVVDEVDYRENEKGVKTVVYRCIKGTSKMTTAEMAKVIDKTLEYAYEVGIDTEYWKGLLEQ